MSNANINAQVTNKNWCLAAYKFQTTVVAICNRNGRSAVKDRNGTCNSNKRKISSWGRWGSIAVSARRKRN
eukprot:602878-Amphidinium_carterae.1